MAHYQAALPNECCGLLAGTIDGAGLVADATDHYPLRNELESPVEFLSNPADMFAAHKEMRRNGTEILAVYHSHPTTAPVPSVHDLARNWMPNVVQIIVGLSAGTVELRGWWLMESTYQPAQIEWLALE